MGAINNSKRAFSANGRFLVGGSVIFGNENQRPDPANPGTLKQIFTDPALSTPALNPQPLDSDAKFEQGGATGTLYGSGTYSYIVLDSNGVETAYVPSFTVISALTAQQAAEAAEAARDAAQEAADSINVPSGSSITLAIPTIVNLRALEPVFDNQQIELLGHTNDGIGGGIFYADFSDTTSTDNNGTIIVTPNGRRWKRRPMGYVTPEMFGALRNETHNDNPAAQAAATAANGLLVLSAGDYYFADGGVSLNNISGITIRGVPGGSEGSDVGTVITMKPDSNGTAFNTDEVNSCDYFEATGIHVRCTSIVENGTAQQALQSKNVTKTVFRDISTDQLSQFAVTIGHFQNGDIDNDLVILDNIDIKRHGKTSLTTQVGLEMIERNNTAFGAAPHPFVRNKYVSNLNIEINNNVSAAILKLGTAENMVVDGLVLRANNRQGTSSALEIAGTSIIPRQTVTLSNVELYDEGTPVRGGIACGEVIDMTMNNVNVETSNQPSVILDVSATATTPRKLTVNNCNLGGTGIQSLRVGGTDTGRVIEVNNSSVAAIRARHDTGATGISEININNSTVDNIEVSISLGSISVSNNSSVGNLNFFTNGGALIEMDSVTFTDSSLNDLNFEWPNANFGRFEFVGGKFGQGATIRTTVNGRPDKMVFRGGVVIAKGSADHQFDATDYIEFTNVELVDNTNTNVTNAIFARTPVIRINNCKMEDIMTTNNIIFAGNANSEIFARLSSFSSVNRAITTLLDTQTAGNVHWRGCVVQDVWVNTLDE